MDYVLILSKVHSRLNFFHVIPYIIKCLTKHEHHNIKTCHSVLCKGKTNYLRLYPQLLLYLPVIRQVLPDALRDLKLIKRTTGEYSSRMEKRMAKRKLYLLINTYCLLVLLNHIYPC